jgi:predicted nuclease of predicted toxin-antitoxin system
MKLVRDVGLKQAPDQAIWNWARLNGFTVVTTDSDFVALSQRLGSPPKVIHLENCRARFRVVEEIIRRNAIVIAEFERHSDSGVLSIRL